MDFITGLPESNGFNACLVVVDRLTKMAHFIATNDTVTSEGLAILYRDNVFKHHGLPTSFVTDRGSVFTSDFSRVMCRLLDIKQNLSTAFHPETDGQTERINGILEQYLRGYCNYQQDNWYDLLSMAEFSYNNTLSATTGVTPFFANYGYHPRYEIHARPQVPLPAQEIIQNYIERLRNLEKFL